MRRQPNPPSAVVPPLSRGVRRALPVSSSSADDSDCGRFVSIAQVSENDNYKVLRECEEDDGARRPAAPLSAPSGRQLSASFFFHASKTGSRFSHLSEASFSSSPGEKCRGVRHFARCLLSSFRRNNGVVCLNRNLLLVLYMLSAFMTACTYFDWPAMKAMLFKSGAYAWLCEDGETELSAEVRSREGVAYLCDAQDGAVSPLFAVCLFSHSFMSAGAGILLDYAGPKVTAVIGQTLNVTGWILLALSGERFPAYIPAAMCIGLSADTSYLPLLRLVGLFRNRRATVISLLGTACTGSFAIPMLLRVIWSKVPQLSFSQLVCGYIIVGPCASLVIALLCVPWRGFDEWITSKSGGLSGEASTPVSVSSPLTGAAVAVTRLSGVECSRGETQGLREEEGLRRAVRLASPLGMASPELSSVELSKRGRVEACGRETLAPDAERDEALDEREEEEGLDDEDIEVEEDLGEGRLASPGVPNSGASTCSSLSSPAAGMMTGMEGHRRRGDEADLERNEETEEIEEEEEEERRNGRGQGGRLAGACLANSLAPPPWQAPPLLIVSSRTSPAVPHLSSQRPIIGEDSDADTSASCRSARGGASSSALASLNNEKPNTACTTTIRKEEGKVFTGRRRTCCCCLCCPVCNGAAVCATDKGDNVSSASRPASSSSSFGSACCCCCSAKRKVDLKNEVSAKKTAVAVQVQPDGSCRSTSGSGEGEKESIIRAFFSLRFLCILLYGACQDIAMAFFQNSAERLLHPTVTQNMDIFVSLSFLPCVFIGVAIDRYGPISVMCAVNTTGLLAYIFALIGRTSVGERQFGGVGTESLAFHVVSLICFCAYISLDSEQVFCYIDRMFEPKHFGRLCGFAQLCAGISSLATIPLYNDFSVRLLHGNCEPAAGVVIGIFTLMYGLLALTYYQTRQRRRRRRQAEEVVSSEMPVAKSASLSLAPTSEAWFRASSLESGREEVDSMSEGRVAVRRSVVAACRA